MTTHAYEVDWAEDAEPDTSGRRKVTLTSAATIKPRRVRWWWHGRMALGALSLVAGPEGLGKSTLVYSLAAQATKGTLEGEFKGTPRGVLIAATEDSWEHTIVPRLMAAGADLERIYRVDVTTSIGVEGALSLPVDIPSLKDAASGVDASLLILDPLTSRLSANLDTHKDSETRLALEPLVRLAHDANVAIVGIMHFNKSGSTDPLALVMASKAFTAVARSVSTVIKDPDDESESARLFGTVKNNLGRADLPTLRFTIDGFQFPTGDGDAWTGKLVWGADAQGSIGEALTRAADSGNQSAAAEAADWLSGFLDDAGGCSASKDVKFAARDEGHGDNSLRAARHRLGVRTINTREKPRHTLWALQTHKECQSCAPSRGEHTTNITNTTRDQERSRVSRVSRVETGAQSTRLQSDPTLSATSQPPEAPNGLLRNLLSGCELCGVQTVTNPCRGCNPTPIPQRVEVAR